MPKVNRQTYASHIKIKLDEYEKVHGLIEAYGGRVKDFQELVKSDGEWIMFYEMFKLQRIDFEKELNDEPIPDDFSTPIGDNQK